MVDPGADPSVSPAEVHVVDAALLGEMLAFGGVHYPVGDAYRSRPFREWLLLANPAGPARVVLIRHAGVLIGQAALIPVDLTGPDRAARAGYFVVDVLTRPEFRNMKLFSRIIDAAMDFARSQDAVLMGHPNRAALRGWQRKAMQFKPPLRSRLMLPARARGRTLSTREDVLAAWADPGASGTPASIGLARSHEFLDWRFFRRPDKSYHVGLRVDRDGAPLAFHASTPWRHGLHLLVDHWTAGRRALATKFPTLAMVPERESGIANALRLPLTKALPYFLTDPAGRDLDAAQITFAASDF